VQNVGTPLANTAKPAGANTKEGASDAAFPPLVSAGKLETAVGGDLDRARRKTRVRPLHFQPTSSSPLKGTSYRRHGQGRRLAFFCNFQAIVSTAAGSSSG
jgi:hypothetical protein